MVKLRINVTKEVLFNARHCTTKRTGENCAIALAVRDIFPNAWVSGSDINPTGIAYYPDRIQLPKSVQTFIEDFDRATSATRIGMSEISFEIEIPDAVLETINIDELKPLLVNHPTLQLV